MRIVLAIALAGAALLTGCRGERPVTQAAVEPPPVTASVITVSAAPFASTVAVTGSLISNSSVEIKAETIGRIVRFDKEAGDPVSAGEAIVWVNDENYRLSLAQAQSAVKVAEAAEERAKLLEAHSRSEMERAENLLKSGGITDKDLKAARLAEQDAKAQLTVAGAQRAEARAALDVAEKRVRDTIIHSPVDGVIQKKHANKGAYVEAPTALFTVVDNRRLELESPVPSVDLAAIRSGQRVRFSVNSFPGEPFEGQVIEIAPAVDAETRAARVRIRIANPGGKLKTGMFAQGEILTGGSQSAIVIPSAAAYRDDRSAKSSYVFVVADGKASKRTIKIGREREGALEIVDGLKPGDLLIAEQSIEIADGVKVKARS